MNLCDIIFLLAVLSLPSCRLEVADQQHKSDGTKQKDQDQNKKKNEIIKEQLKESGNTWADENSWGNVAHTRDTTGKTAFKDDSHIDEIYKKNFPFLNDHYVLWRVHHNGTCWIQSGMIQLVARLVDLDQKTFKERLDALKQALPATVDKNAGWYKKFFDIFEVLEKKRDLKIFLDMSAREHVFDALNAGFRNIILAYHPEYSKEEKEKLLKPCEWGDITDFNYIFEGLNLPIDTVYQDNGAVYISFKSIKVGSETLVVKFTIKNGVIEFDNLFGTKEDLKEIDDKSRSLERPKIISFGSSPGYMDLLVDKDFSKKINQ